MTVPSAVPDAAPAGPEPRRHRVLTDSLVVLALLAQGFVGLATFVMGLGWGGPTYVAALVQAVLAFVVIARLAGRRRRLVVLVPVASAALSVGLAFAGHVHGRATACSDAERTAAGQLAPPPGTTVRLEGDYTEGCVAWATMSLSNQQIVEHYRAEFARLGWQETPGRHEMTFGAAAVTDGVHVTVDIEDEGGQMLEVTVGGRTEPCQVNRIGFDASLPREPTGEVEPGQWVMLASADGLPASVTIRDGTGAVVLERPAHRRPRDADDLMELELPTLSLDEGVHEIECESADGAVTLTPLRVAWAPDPVERERAVVVRVFEAPDTGGEG